MKHTLEINASGVKYKDSFIGANEYEWLSLKAVQHTTNFTRDGTYRRITIFGGNKEIRIDFDDVFYGKSRGKLYAVVVPAVMEQVGSIILTNIISRLSRKIDVAIGDASFGVTGADLCERNFWGRKGNAIFVPYERLHYCTSNGIIWLSDSLHKKLACSFPYAVGNGCLIGPLHNFLMKQNR